MNKTDINKFVRLVTGTRIRGHDDSGHKAEFCRLGQRVLHALAAKLGYPPGTYEVRWNPGGPAGSGDLRLHTDHVYVVFEQSPISGAFFYRSCDGRDDFVGGCNEFASWGRLKDLDKLAAEIRANVPEIPLQPALKPTREARPKKDRYAKVKGAFATPREALIAKLSPARLDGKWSPMFIGMIGDLLDWDGPRTHMMVTSDGFVLVDQGNGVAGTVGMLKDNCIKVCKDVGDVTDEELEYLLDRKLC